MLIQNVASITMPLPRSARRIQKPVKKFYKAMRNIRVGEFAFLYLNEDMSDTTRTSIVLSCTGSPSRLTIETKNSIWRNW